MALAMALSQLLFHVQKLSGPDIKYIHTCKEQRLLTICKAINGKSTAGRQIAHFTSCGKQSYT